MSNIPKDARWDPSKVMGSDCTINLVTGPRSLGKTYAMKKLAIKQYIKRGATWGYVRFNESMIDKILKHPEPFLGDIDVNREFPDYVFRNNGTRLQIAERSKNPKWESFGSMISMTSFDAYKGSTTPKMGLLTVDEFIKEKEKTSVPYPPGVVKSFYNMWETFDRREDRLKVVMLANTADLVNPFFREWHIDVIPKGTTRKFQVGLDHVLYENAWNPKYEEFAKKTGIGRITAGSDYEDYALSNNFASNSGLFIGSRPNNIRCQMAIKWRSNTFGVWPDNDFGDVFITRKPAKDCGVMVLSRDDMSPNYMMIDRNSPYLKWLLKAFQYGQLLFDSDTTREEFLDMLQLCGLK